VSKRSSRLRAGAEAAAAAVDAEALAAELAALVRIPSITGDEDAIQAYLADRLDTLVVMLVRWSASCHTCRPFS